MVLEWLLKAKYDRKHPLSIFVFSFIVSLISIFISYFVFKESTGLFIIVIISLALVTFINSMFRYEEIETEELGTRQNFLQRHGDIISAFASMFLGIVVAMSFAFVILPDNVVENIFNEQIREVNLIQGRFTFGGQFLEIIANNASVLILSFLFSFLIGTGAILILAWNASVLSAAIGLIAKSLGGIRGIPVAVLTFLPHGVFELTAYFIGAIAGGLISVALIRKNSRKFWFVVQDSLKLILVSFMLLMIGGVIETIILLT
jgi:uncharacterized membrane protein SpoIIM required for sporulation